jgi:hypothetical protein
MTADRPAAALDDLFAQPELMRAQMTGTAKLVAQKLLADLTAAKR